MTETALILECAGEQLLGIHHAGAPGARVGVLIVVGGPQYRVGSHRQFVLLARHLSANGVPAFRFDYRGMGDASGEMRDFEAIRDDITCAIDVFLQHTPGLERVVIWGLCDAASAALDYAWRDTRVAGLVLLNPWVRTDEGLAKAYLKHYYLRRLMSRAFWGGLVRGRVNPLASLRSLGAQVRKALTGSRIAGGGDLGRVSAKTRAEGVAGAPIDSAPLAPGQALPVRMAEGWRRFRGPILLILSGDDLTAAEFKATVRDSAAWAGLLGCAGVEQHELAEANHTFSREAWRCQVEQWTAQWVKERFVE